MGQRSRHQRRFQTWLNALVAFATLGFATIAAAATPLHPPCAADITTYQAPYVRKQYNVSKALGTWYELAFRDLYPVRF